MFSNEMSAARQNEPSIKTFQTKTGENNSGWALKKRVEIRTKKENKCSFLRISNGNYFAFVEWKLPAGFSLNAADSYGVLL